MMTARTVEIVGAGPSGLSAALAARAQGAAVTVFEKRADAGGRFHGDFQGLDNWTSERNVLAELEDIGVRTDFAHTPAHEIVGFGLRYALLSGHLAGTSDSAHGRYERQWAGRLGALNATSVFNRRLYTWLGERGRKAVLRRVVAGGDPRRLLQRVYAPVRWKVFLAKWLQRAPLLRSESVLEDCDCTWCRCSRRARESSEHHA